MSIPTAPPDISVLMASSNRPATLAATLDALKQQVAGGLSWELIVVDNGTTAPADHVVAEYEEQLPLLALRERRRGKSRALNLAMSAARGDLVVFTDDDVRPVPIWLAALFGASRRWPDYAVLCGPIELGYAAPAPVWLQSHVFAAMAFSRLLFDDVPEGPLPPPHLPFGPNFAVRAPALHGMRFREDLGPGTACPIGDETEFLERLRTSGHRILYVPTACVVHIVSAEQLQWRSMLRRAFEVGVGYAIVHPVEGAATSRTSAWRGLPRAAHRWLRSTTAHDEQARFEAAAAFCFQLGHAEGRRLARVGTVRGDGPAEDL